MATYTENYSLVKPGYGDQADIDVLNRLMTDKVDALLFENRRISADEYDQTETYAVGDYAIYENVLYKCLEDTTGNFDPSKWEMTNLAKEVSTKVGADVTKTASGNPITFTDGASAPLVKCVTEIQGYQDLHGYDKPWVGGAGKNKLEVTGTSTTVNGVTFTINSDGTVKANGTASDITTWIIGWITVESGKTYTLSGSPNNPSVNSYWIDVRDGSSIYNNWTEGNPTYTATETKQVNVRIRIASGYTINNLVFKPQIEVGSTATAYEPYSNICPITAYTEGEIEVRGRNLTDVVSITTLPNTGNIRNTNGTIYTEFVKGKTYTVSFDLIVAQKSDTAEGNRLGLWLNDSDTSLWRPPITAIGHQSFTFTAETDGYVNFWCTNAFNAEIKVIDNIQVEEGSVEHDYEPYTSTTHTTTYPSAIYRGSEDCVEGTVECEVKYFTPTTWSRNTDHSYYTREFMTELASTGNVPCICDKLKEWDGEEPTTNYGICFVNSAGAIRINTVKAYASVEDMVADMGEMHFACTLPTPTTSSVTPTNLPIRTLSGYTHIESSTGDMEVEYITEDYQPLVDLIESNKHVYSTAEQIVGTWVDGKPIYEKTFVFPNEITLTTNTWVSLGVSLSGVETPIGSEARNSRHAIECTVDFLDDPITAMSTLENNSGKITSVTVRYTKSTSTRSLNFTKSAVNEIPDEIKNAEYEEKPDVNEADDSAPTEVDER